MKTKLGSLTRIRTGKLDANAAVDGGQYPFFTCAKEPLAIASYSYDCECVLVAGNGDLNVKYYNGKFDAYQRTYIIENNDDILYMPYLYYFMNYYIDELRRQSIGGIIKYIRLGNLTGAEIDLPSQTKQKEIVNHLSSLSSLIDMRNDELIKLDALVKSRFVEMFGDPVSNPMNLPNAKLADFCDLLNGYAFKSGNYVENSDVLNCRMSNIRPGGLFDAEYNPKYLPSDYWDMYSKFQLADGDIIIAMTDMANDPKILGVPTIVKTGGRKFLLNQRVGKLVIENPDRFNNVYLMYSLSQKHIRLKLASKAGKSMQVNVGKPAILAIQILEPPLALQQEFASFVAQVDKSGFAVRQSIEQLEILKAKLMQEYFG